MRSDGSRVVNAGMLVVIVATGATVRLTGSGLGCEHWPGCQAHHFEPTSYHSYIEFSNRVVAFLTILVTLVDLDRRARPPAARRAPSSSARSRRRRSVRSRCTTTSTRGSCSRTSCSRSSCSRSAVVLAVEARARASDTPLPGWVPRAGSLVGLAACVLVVSGTLATASGPHPGSSGRPRRLWSFQPAVYWHVRATAVFGISFALLLVWLVRHRAPQVRGALVLLGLLAVQMTIGEMQYRTQPAVVARARARDDGGDRLGGGRLRSSSASGARVG